MGFPVLPTFICSAKFKRRSCNPSSAGSKIWCPIVEISDLRSDICVGPNGWTTAIRQSPNRILRMAD
ncbi:hypothetical protein GJ744_001739 [Endocarpon pusillum]|uniref:Uncharacterized protein n=1 Tax=Endocarpon pusillum TaxID=364733 RepID=A0A8H7E346_9EURO|nr:hypothetical protein GJ744_001739 [Endocarpon pusillum]